MSFYTIKFISKNMLPPSHIFYHVKMPTIKLKYLILNVLRYQKYSKVNNTFTCINVCDYQIGYSASFLLSKSVCFFHVGWQ